MAKQNTSRQIAAHFAQSYMDKSGDTEILRDFTSVLEKRVSTLKKSGDRICCRDVSSLLYCVKDLNGSCRDAAADLSFGDKKAAEHDVDRASLRVREVGQLLSEIKQNHPHEYEKSCSGFVEKWRGMNFNKGSALLTSETEPAQTPEESLRQFTPQITL